MSSSRTPAQNKRIHQLIGQLNISAEIKAEMVFSFTENRTGSTSEMSYDEAKYFISYLEQEAKKRELKENSPENRMRKKVLAICHNLGWYQRNEGGKLVLKNSKPQLDWRRIDGFCIERGPYKKKLQEHTYQELITLISVFEKL